MRSENETPSICEETDVKVICAVEEAAEEYKDCPAACRKDNTKEEDNNEDTVVKAGNLDVSVEGESNGRLFIGRASDLDTITLKTSEEVTISKIILERIGYSTKDNIDSVWLEDENGTKIAEEKTLDSKGQVKLTLKKDYKVVNGELNATVVVVTHKVNPDDGNNLAAGSTVGFKVVDVESTAKDSNISGKANTYTAIDYDGSKMTLIPRANNQKEYNWTAEELYEVAKFKVNTPDDSSIILRGFTFKNVAGGNTALDLRKYFDKAEVTIAGEKVSGLDASVNKSDELVVTFKDYEVAAKTKAEVIVKIALVEDFDEFPSNLTLSLTDYTAVDGKVESRVKAEDSNGDLYGTTANLTYMTPYVFKGGKVKISNTKLGNVDAAQDSEDIKVAEGSITVPEAVKGTFIIKATGNGASFIKQMTVSINKDETDANPMNCTINNNNNDVCYFAFKGVEIEKSGKVEFFIDVKNLQTAKETISFSSFNAESFNPAGANQQAGITEEIKYDESGKSALTEVSGSISFSKVTLQPARASLSNSTTKDQEFANNDSQRKTIFEGTYTAKKGDVKLNEFLITSNSPADVAAAIATNKITFYVYVDDMENEVADAKITCAGNDCTAGDTFDNVLVKAEESVKVKVEAEVETSNQTDADGDMTDGNNKISSIDLGKYKVELWGEDANGNNNSGRGDATSAKIKVVNKGSVSISTGSTKQTIIRKASDAKVAEFTVKPAKGSESVDLETISFKLSDNTLTPSDITLKVDGVTEDDATQANDKTITYSMNKEVTSDKGVTVLITIDDEDKLPAAALTLSDLKVNGKGQSKTFTKQFVPAAVEIVKNENKSGSTVFTLDVDADSDTDVANFAIVTNSPTYSKTINGTFEDGKTISITNEKDVAHEVNTVAYLYSEEQANAAAACYVVNTANAAGIAVADTTADANAAACTTAGGVWAEAGYVWKQITITKVSLPDYFQIEDVDIKVFG